MSGVPASDGSCTRARPASHVWNASVDVRRRTRTRSEALHQRLTIGRSGADRAGARPYHFDRNAAIPVTYLVLYWSLISGYSTASRIGLVR
jgi:hypothetical protein